MPRARAVVGCFVFLFAATVASARGTSGALVGTVSTNGAPLAGVEVTVFSASLLGSRTVTTGDTGRYSFPTLPPGLYDVTFAREGMQQLTRRAHIELAQTARLDTTLQPSEEGESVTSTALVPTVMETPVMATTFGATLVDRLPIDRSLRSIASLAPGAGDPRALLIDGVVTARDLAIEDAVEETTILRGALPPEFGFASGVVAAVTRSGGNELSGSLRDTVSDPFDDSRNTLEGTLGGRVLTDRLWFFAAAREGRDDAWQGKLSGLLLDRHQLTASYTSSEDHGSLSSLQYRAMLTSALAVEALRGGTRGGESYRASGSYLLGDHDLRAGFDDRDSALFISDHWHLGNRWSIQLGLRHEDDLDPRLAATYDLGSVRPQRIAISYSEYGDISETALSYATALGASGAVRIDVLHGDRDAAQVQAGYRLFTGFDVGGNLTFTDEGDGHRGNLWLAGELPRGPGTLRASLLERYADERFATDLALRYDLPVARTTLTLLADLVDAFDEAGVRVGARLRF